MPQHLLAQLVVAVIGVGADGGVEQGADLGVEGRGRLFFRLRVRLVPAIQGLPAGGEQAGAAGERPEAAHRPRGGDDPAVGALLEELVVAGVDEEEVRMIADQLLHQERHPVAGVADAAGVEHLPGSRRVGGGQQLAQTAA